MSSTSIDFGKAVSCIEERAEQENFMDMNNSRPTRSSGEPTLDSGDWRAELRHDSRQRIVNKIVETLRRHLPFCGQEGLNELREIALRFEEKVFIAARSLSDYLKRISLKMLTMEIMCQNNVRNTGNNSKPPFPGSQGMLNQVHSQEQSIPIRLQQLLLQSVPNNMASAGVQSSAVLQSGVPFVSDLSQNPISNVVAQNSNMQNISAISQNSIYQGMPSNIFANQMRQIQGRQQVLPQQQQQNLLQLTQLQSSQQSDSTAQTGYENGGDWQEEVYQKLKAMKETYLPEIKEMHQKISAKLLQQPKSEQLDKLKLFKTMLERVIHFLTSSRASIIPAHKEKISSYEKQIINFINACRLNKSVSAVQQGQLPPLHMHSMQQPQPQINQTQSHDNQMNPQLQSINLQGSMPTMQLNTLTSSLAAGNSEKLIYNASCLLNTSHQQGTYEQAGSGCPAPDPTGNGMSTMSIPHLSTGFSKLNIAEKPHDPMVNKVNPNSLRSTVVTIVDEASTAVSEDLAAMRKQGLCAFTQTGMSGAFQIRCYSSVLVILTLIICFIFKFNRQ